MKYRIVITAKGLWLWTSGLKWGVAVWNVNQKRWHTIAVTFTRADARAILRALKFSIHEPKAALYRGPKK